ncbi:MAG: aminopeptidase P family protein [Rhodospirillales bacterium]|nr:aminopeptidase P family protein [Rhodospirillales bacterium]
MTKTDYAVTMQVPKKEYCGLAFSLPEYRRRYDLVMGAMRARGLDALLLRCPENICYLTGHETSGTYTYQVLVLSQDEPLLVIRWIEEPNAFEYSWLKRTVTVKDHEQPLEKMAAALAKMGLADKRIGLELSTMYVTHAEYEGTRQVLPKATLADASGLVEEFRMIKSEEELTIMREAARIVEKGVQAGMDAVAPGVSENHIAAEVHRVIVGEGGEFMSLPPYILAGPRTRLSHGTWRGGRVAQGEHVYFEVSACKHRYSSAIMRSICPGEPKNPILRPLAKAVNAGLEAGLAKVRAGVVAEDVDTAVRSTIAKEGFGDIRFGDHHKHRAAYSIGINFPPDWGEGQIISIRQGEKRKLQANMTFHMVPDVRIWPIIGYGCSTTFRVTDNGYEELTKAFPHELIIK